ncbi:glycosyltransferase [Aerococcaceae bacterium NML210727]|nr:glycosyltransferase [Aerococcaceae bacterium NML210727]MCW6654803.1 glycosyltransferase [Aerococcaceae bacterium NML201296]
MQYILSIIIPAYNAERTIIRAIDSVIQQATEHIELIIVENGSKDDTFDKIQKFIEPYPFCRLLRSEKGVSVARNVGIQHAQGEWVTFLDADDYLVEKAIDAMLSDIRRHRADMYVYAIRSGMETYNNVAIDDQRYTQTNILRKLIENPTKYMQVYANIYHKETLQKNEIEFNTKLSFSEDSDFTMQYLRVCNHVLLSNRVVVFCPNDEKSTTRTFDGRKYEQYLMALQHTERHAAQLGPVGQDAYIVYTWMNFNVLMVRDVFTEDNKQRFEQKVAEMKRILSYEFFQKKLTETSLTRCTKLNLLPVLFIKLKLPYIAALGYAMRAKRNARHERYSRKKYEKENRDV